MCAAHLYLYSVLWRGLIYYSMLVSSGAVNVAGLSTVAVDIITETNAWPFPLLRLTSSTHEHLLIIFFSRYLQ
jgi:hypothetical protein